MSEITDTDRINWLAGVSGRTQGVSAEDFREGIDAEIIAEREATARQCKDEWLDLTVEFPADDVAVRVRASDGQIGRACYCTVAGDWYVYCPDTAIHGLLWSEVHGPDSEIIQWQAVPDTHISA